MSAADFLERNLKAWDHRISRPEKVELTQTDDTRREDAAPWPALSLRDGTRWLPMHSRRDPLREAARALEPADLDTTSTLFVIGFGLGYIADVLESRQWPGRVVALDTDVNSVSACLSRRDWTAWLSSGRLLFAWAPEYRTVEAIVLRLDPDREHPAVVVNPTVARCRPEWTKDAARRAARTWFGARANQEAKRRMAGRYLLNTLRNASAIATAGDAAALDRRFEGIPAILAAAGPSLDANLADIRAYRDRAVLIAVDTALRPLLTAGIVPDLAVAVDPSEANARHLIDLPACTTTHLVTEGSIDPEVVRSFGDRLFVFRVGEHHPWPWLQSLGINRGTLRAWGSVLTTAFDLALRMGCDPLVFAGADLAFTGGRPYARGTTYEEDWRREAAWGRSLEQSWQARVAEWPHTMETDVLGASVRTAPHLVAFRDWLADESARACRRTVVNATNGGILQGAGILQSTIANALQALPVVAPRPLEAIVSARESDRQSAAWVPGDVSDETSQDWCTFARISADAWAHALARGRTDHAHSHAEATREPRANQDLVDMTGGAEPVDLPTLEHDGGLTKGDASFMAQLSATHVVRTITLRDAEQDLLAELRTAVAQLTPGSAVVVIDALGQAVGAQVRRAVNAILCEHPTVWLEYRRFVDPDSRVSVLRVDAPGHARPLAAIDDPKWQAEHEAVADGLAPLLVAALGPQSVIDIGCGAGYWLRAFEQCGVSRLRGVTVRQGQAAIHPGVTTVEPNELLTGLPSLLGQAGDRYDLCLALEVAQELPPTAHPSFVGACTRLSDTVVFSYRLPGIPGGMPYGRPLTYWSDLFWREGFVLEDRLRGRIEERWNFPRTVFDGPLVFRRSLTPDDRRDVRQRARYRQFVERLHDLYELSIWWAVRSFALEKARVTPARPLSVDYRWWPVPAWRWLGEPGDARRLVFRTDAARWYLTDPRAAIDLAVDGVPSARMEDPAALATSAAGGWTLIDDELMVKTADGTDPRTNGRRYAIRLPAFVVWAESQSLADSVAHGL